MLLLLWVSWHMKSSDKGWASSLTIPDRIDLQKDTDWSY